MVSASMAIQHAKWLEARRGARLARAGRLAERAADLDLLAQRPQRLQPPGPGPDRHDDLDARQRGARLPAARRQLPAVGRRPLLPQPRLRQPDRDRQAAPAAVPRRSEEARAHCAAGASIWDWAGTDGERGARCGPRLRRRRADDGDAGGGGAVCASTFRTCAVRVVNVVDLMALAPAGRPPARLSEERFDELFGADARGRDRLPRLRPGRCISCSTAGGIPAGSTSAATASRAPPRPRSTWSS